MKSHNGHNILSDAGIGYWANTEIVGWLNAEDGSREIDSIRVRDFEDEDAEWSQEITADDLRDALVHFIIKGQDSDKFRIHPRNYAFTVESYNYYVGLGQTHAEAVENTDYDSDTGDWLIQQLAFGEQIFG